MSRQWKGGEYLVREEEMEDVVVVRVLHPLAGRPAGLLDRDHPTRRPHADSSSQTLYS